LAETTTTTRILPLATSTIAHNVPVQTHVLKGLDNSASNPVYGMYQTAPYLPPCKFDFKHNASLPPVNYSVGDRVDVLSSSERAWVTARVSAVDAIGTATVTYAGKTKAVPALEQSKMLRVSAVTLPEPEDQMYSDADTIYPKHAVASKYTAEQAIQVFSDSQQCWVAAVVCAVQTDGTVNVKYSNGATKAVGPAFHDKYLKPCATTVATSAAAIGRRNDDCDPPTLIGGYGHCGRSLRNETAPSEQTACGSSSTIPESKPPYAVGQSVQVYSDSKKSWLSATVVNVKDSGFVTVEYGCASKEIAPVFLSQYLRLGLCHEAAKSADEVREPPTVIGGYGLLPSMP